MPATSAMSVGNVSAVGLCSIYAQEKRGITRSYAGDAFSTSSGSSACGSNPPLVESYPPFGRLPRLADFLRRSLRLRPRLLMVITPYSLGTGIRDYSSETRRQVKHW